MAPARKKRKLEPKPGQTSKLSESSGANILDLPAGPLGPLHQIFSLISDIPTKLHLESVCKSFRNYALKYCWEDFQELKITFNRGGSDVTWIQYENGVELIPTSTRKWAGLIQNAKILIRKGNRSLHTLFLEGCTVFRRGFFRFYDPRPEVMKRICNIMNEFENFTSITLQRVQITAGSPILDFLVKQTYLSSLVLYGADLDSPLEALYSIGRCKGLKNLTFDSMHNLSINSMVMALSRLSLVSSFILKDNIFDCNDELTEKFDNDDIISILSCDNNKLDTLVVVGISCFFLRWMAILQDEKCKSTLAGLRILKIDQWQYEDRFFDEFYKLVEICPTLEELTIETQWEWYDFEEPQEASRRNIDGIKNMVSKFFTMHKDVEKPKILEIDWEIEDCDEEIGVPEVYRLDRLERLLRNRTSESKKIPYFSTEREGNYFKMEYKNVTLKLWL